MIILCFYLMCIYILVNTLVPLLFHMGWCHIRSNSEHFPYKTLVLSWKKHSSHGTFWGTENLQVWSKGTVTSQVRGQQTDIVYVNYC